MLEEQCIERRCPSRRDPEIEMDCGDDDDYDMFADYDSDDHSGIVCIPILCTASCHGCALVLLSISIVNLSAPAPALQPGCCRMHCIDPYAGGRPGFRAETCSHPLLIHSVVAEDTLTIMVLSILLKPR